MYTGFPYAEDQYQLANRLERTHSHPDGMRKYQLPRVAFNVIKQDMQGEKLSCDGTQAVVYKTAWLDKVKPVWSKVKVRFEEPGVGQATHSE